MKSDLTFDEWFEIGSILNELSPADKELVINKIEHINNRVRSLETTMNNCLYNMEYALNN